MVRHAANAAREHLRGRYSPFGAATGPARICGRLALICALTVLVAEIYQTPEPALTTYVVFFLNRDNRTISLILDVVFVALITVIIGFIFLLPWL